MQNGLQCVLRAASSICAGVRWRRNGAVEPLTFYRFVGDDGRQGYFVVDRSVRKLGTHGLFMSVPYRSRCVDMPWEKWRKMKYNFPDEAHAADRITMLNNDPLWSIAPSSVCGIIKSDCPKNTFHAWKLCKWNNLYIVRLLSFYFTATVVSFRAA